MMSHPISRSLGLLRRGQRGVVLFISLIVLVAMSLAGIALMRSVDSGVMIAGNLAFKQGTTLAGDSGVEAARTALSAIAGLGSNSLWTSTSASYFSLVPASEPDFTGTDPNKAAYDWSGTTTVNGLTVNNSTTVTGVAGTTEVRYVIHRLCAATGDPSATVCARGTTTSSATSSQTVRDAAGAANFTVGSAQYYRITTRVIGARNTKSYVEVVVN
jgi:type IV pilus assembly protein PilX